MRTEHRPCASPVLSRPAGLALPPSPIQRRNLRCHYKGNWLPCVMYPAGVHDFPDWSTKSKFLPRPRMCDNLPLWCWQSFASCDLSGFLGHLGVRWWNTMSSTAPHRRLDEHVHGSSLRSFNIHSTNILEKSST